MRDDTGLALIYPSGSDCKVRFGVAEECNGISLPPCYADYMSQEHLGLRNLWRLSMLRFRERLLESGQSVYVLGTAMPRPQVQEISDIEVLEATGTNGPADRRFQTLHEETVAIVRRGPNEPTFIISQESERELALELGARALGKLVAGPALTLFGLGYWLYALSSRSIFK